MVVSLKWVVCGDRLRPIDSALTQMCFGLGLVVRMMVSLDVLSVKPVDSDLTQTCFGLPMASPRSMTMATSIKPLDRRAKLCNRFRRKQWKIWRDWREIYFKFNTHS